MFETTEEKDIFSWPHTHFGTHEPRTGDDHYSSVFTSDIKHILDLPGWHATVLSVANGSPRGRHILPRNSRCGFSTSWLQVTADGRPAGWFFCASQTRLRAVLGLKAEDAFWDGCAWALTVRLHPHVRVCPPIPLLGALGALGTEGAAPEDTEPVGTASTRPLETLTAIQRRGRRGVLNFRGITICRNLQVHEPHFHVSGCTGTFGGESVGFRQPPWRDVTRAIWFLLPDLREHASDGCVKEGNCCTFWCNLNEFHWRKE